MISRWILVIGGLLLCLATQVHAAVPLSGDKLRQALDQVIDSHPASRRTTITLKVLDLETGKVLYDRGGDKLMTPASNLKLYTSACALETFGPDHRFETTVRAPRTNLDEDKLGGRIGDLTLVGGGDAMLTRDDLAELATRVVGEWDLQQIVGRVRVDNSRYAGPLKGPGWMWDDDPADYNMPVTPLMVDFNVLTVQLRPVGGKVAVRLSPSAGYPPLRRVDAKRDENVRVTRKPFEDEILIIGGQPPAEVREERLTMHDPARWAAVVFARMLEAQGVELTGVSGLPDEKPGEVEEITHRGTALAETLQHFHHASENAVGEVLLHEIAIARGANQPGWPEGAAAITRWLIDNAGLEEGSFRLVDGSGLSRYNLISAGSSVRLLQYMHGHEHFQVFFESLPTSNVNGKPVVSAKGGSMTGVSTISGYIKTDAGRLLAFSLLANGFIGDNKPIMDLRQRVWQELVRYKPD
jgi:D-alanyl-D-alanine carboxypeptidase/D-alanyl-D-alanine-endopeptidase (penicillin-binding protein 4)